MNATTVQKMHSTRVDLPERTRIDMIELLNRRLAECLDLGLQARHAHWNVSGPYFIALHELFGRLYADVDRHADLLAERAVQLGGLAEGTANAVVNRSDLEPYPVSVEGSEHVRLVAARLASWSSLLRASISPAAESGDPVTADILTEISRGIDKWLWLVEANAARS